MKVYHDHNEDDSWTEITNIVSYPVIQNRINQFNAITFSIRDKLGALYSTWSGYDFIPIKVEDDNTKILFRGYVTGKKFTHNLLRVTVSSFGSVMDWTPLHKNYILEEGLVKSIPATTVNLTDTLVPNGDDTEEWLHTGADSYTEVIDDSDATFIYAQNGSENDVTIFDMEGTGDLTNGDDVTECTQIVVTLRCNTSIAGATTNETYVAVSGGGAFTANETVVMSGTKADKTATFTDLSYDDDEIDALQVRITASPTIAAGDSFTIYEVEAEITYTGTSNESLYLERDSEPAVDYSWEPTDYWSNDQDTGLLIVDNTVGLDTRTWEVSATAVTNGTNNEGDIDSYDTSKDDDVYDCQEAFSGGAAPYTADAEINPTVSGVVIADTNVLHSITINYRFGIQMAGIGRGSTKTWTLEAKKDADWKTIIPYTTSYYHATTKWFEGSYVVPETDDAELAKWLSKVDEDYTGLKEIRLTLLGYDNSTDNDAYMYIDKLTVDVEYDPYEITPFMDKIDHSGDTWVLCHGNDFTQNNVQADDGFKIGQNTTQILVHLAAEADIDIYVQSTLTKYIAQHFKGTYCSEILKRICLLEGMEWWEDHSVDPPVLVISKKSDMVDSTENLTQADYFWDWEYEDDCNYYKAVEVYGNAAYNIYWKEEDEGNDSLKVKTIIEETVATLPEARDIAVAQLALLKDKRPSCRLSLKGTMSNLQIGTTVDVDMTDPDSDLTTAPIRMIRRERLGLDDIKTTIWCGMGSTEVDEKLTRKMNEIAYLAHKAHTDRLISTPYAAGASIQWSDIGGADAGAVSAVSTDDAYLKNTGDTLEGNLAVDAGVTIDGLDISEHVHDGDTLECDTIQSDGAGAFGIKTNGDINLKPDSDDDDYIQFSTAADVPTMSFQGGNGLITNVADPTNAQDVATKAYVDELPATINCMGNVQVYNGTLQGVWHGRVSYMNLSDNNAGIRASFYVENGGSFKVRFIFAGNQDNDGEISSGLFYISEHVESETSAWNLENADNLDLTLGDTGIIMYQDSDAYTIPDDARVGVQWQKDTDDTAVGGNPAGLLMFYGFMLVRQ